MTLDPIDGSGADIAELVNSRQISARDIVRRCLDKISMLDELVNAFTDVLPDRAFAEAARVDARIAAGERLPLAGVPFAVANAFDLAGVITRAGSAINRANDPATRDATVVSRLVRAGAICLGALNIGEYGQDCAGRNSHDGDCRNPHATGRFSGGAAGGPAAAVAAGLVAFTVAADSVGAHRVPASFCGVFALTPTYGRLSRARVFQTSASLDRVGVLARSVADLALAFDAMQGPDDADPHMAMRPFLGTADDIDYLTPELRVAPAGGFFRSEQDPRPEMVVAAVRAAIAGPGGIGPTGGIVIDDRPLADAAEAGAAAALIAAAEAGALHIDRLRNSPEHFDPAARVRLAAGALLPAAWVARAERFRRLHAERIAEHYRDVDVIVAPATPFDAPLRADASACRTTEASAFARPLSLSGVPTVTVPVWLDGERLPIGVQLASAPWREDVTLKLARRLELLGAARAPIAMIGG